MRSHVRFWHEANRRSLQPHRLMTLSGQSSQRNRGFTVPAKLRACSAPSHASVNRQARMPAPLLGRRLSRGYHLMPMPHAAWNVSPTRYTIARGGGPTT